MNAALFTITVLIWGTSWIAITYQVGPVPVVVSVFYRFAVASVLFLCLLAVTGQLKLPRWRDQPWILALALCLFSFNFILFYTAAAHIPSGLISLVFSLATVFNAFNARIFFGERITGRALLASCVGIFGLALLFGAELTLDNPLQTLRGIGFACLGTILFSLGNMISRRNTEAGLSTMDANAWGMGYGAIILLAIVLASGTQLVVPTGSAYLFALLYLAVAGSVVGFTAYLMLVARIGASQAAYATVLFPVVALAISTFAEGYGWTWVKALGVLLALTGNVIMFSRNPRFMRRRVSGACDLVSD